MNEDKKEKKSDALTGGVFHLSKDVSNTTQGQFLLFSGHEKMFHARRQLLCRFWRGHLVSEDRWVL
jgi:hypothetical protein